MIPPLETRADAQSNAELRLASLLAQIDEKNAVAYHSVNLPRHVSKERGEIDFVVLWRGTVLVIEVKGGRVGRRGGQWVFTNRYGQENFKKEGPFEQACSAMYSLRARLSEALGPTHFIHDGYLVVAPDQQFPEDLEYERYQWIGPSQMNPRDLATALTVASKNARRDRRDPSRIRSVPDETSRELQRVLRKDFDGFTRWVDLEGEIERQRLHVTEDQANTLEALSANDRIMVVGGAGTGKTLLAIECVRREALAGKTAAFCCGSVGVQELARKSLHGTDAKVFSPKDLGNEGPFDLIAVDEAQDVMNSDDMERVDRALSGGLLSGRWWFFLDPNNQAHVEGMFDSDFYELLLLSATLVALSRNVRNTDPVVTWIEKYLGADLGKARIMAAGKNPESFVLGSRGKYSIEVELTHALTRLHKVEGVSLDDAVIITCLDSIDDSALDIRRTEHGNFFQLPDGQVPVRTSREMKGLECRYAFIVDLDEFKTSEEKSRAYVACTRASDFLWAPFGPSAWKEIEPEFIARLSTNGSK